MKQRRLLGVVLMGVMVLIAVAAAAQELPPIQPVDETITPPLS